MPLTTLHLPSLNDITGRYYKKEELDDSLSTWKSSKSCLAKRTPGSFKKKQHISVHEKLKKENNFSSCFRVEIIINLHTSDTGRII